MTSKIDDPQKPENNQYPVQLPQVTLPQKYQQSIDQWNEPLRSENESAPSQPTAPKLGGASIKITSHAPPVAEAIPQVTNPEVADVVPQPSFASNLEGALYWFQFGLSIIPVVEKVTVLKWDGWLADLSVEKITAYWTQHPDHEAGCITGDNLLVLDADTAQATAALVALEAEYKIFPDMIVQTKKGEHHYFYRPVGVFARQDSHSTEKFPERLDVKTGRSMVVLAPSKGKVISKFEAANIYELSSVTQDFVDAIFLHNGRPAPRQSHAVSPVDAMPQAELVGKLAQIDALLKWIDSNCGYQDWVGILMAIHHESGGSAAGFSLADGWSSQGTGYAGSDGVAVHWKSFKTDSAKKKTIGSLIMLARAAGADVAGIMNEYGEDAFEDCQGVVVHQNGTSTPMAKAAQTNATSPSVAPTSENAINPLERYFIHDLAELERQAVNQVLILGCIILMGQASVIYAKQNTGKTLIILALIIAAIKAGKFDPSKLIYINMDDDSNGLAVKAGLAKEYGFEMVADGHHGFEAKAFRVAMENMITNNTAHGVIIVLDTLKKFVNTMDKEKSSSFAGVIRRFVLRGGTLIALAHANKHPDNYGKTIYSGTTDIIDDFDCGYTLTTISQDADAKLKVVLLENIKRRGAVALEVSYSYAYEQNIPYTELLMTVQKVNPDQVTSLKNAAEVQSDAVVIDAIESRITGGINTKMKLADAAAVQANCSRRNALKVLDKYTGDDSTIHRWRYVVGDRGAKLFELLERPTAPASDTVVTNP